MMSEVDNTWETFVQQYYCLQEHFYNQSYNRKRHNKSKVSTRQLFVYFAFLAVNFTSGRRMS